MTVPSQELAARQVTRDNDARLVWQIFVAKAVEAGEGRHVFVWEGMPSGLRSAFIDAISIVINERYRSIVRDLREQLRVEREA